MDIQELAGKALEFFTLNVKGHDSLKDDRPEWLRDLVYEAHQGMLPDDYIYRFVRESLEAIAGGDEDGDSLEPDFMTHELLNWVGSNLRRTGYVDEALEEAGHKSMDAAMMAGQASEMREVFEIVKRMLEEQLEEIEAGEA